jgi:hypothetical protein
MTIVALLSACGFSLDSLLITQNAITGFARLLLYCRLADSLLITQRHYWIRTTVALLSPCGFAVDYTNTVTGFARLLVYCWLAGEESGAAVQIPPSMQPLAKTARRDDSAGEV